MNHRPSLAYALFAEDLDPLVVVRNTRFAAAGHDAGKFRILRQNAYRAAVRRLGKPVDLPSDNPFSPSPETARVMNALVRREAALKGGLCLERL